MRGTIICLGAILAGALYYRFQLPNESRAGEELADCFGATEQTILLRQLALAGKAREMFDWCASNQDWSLLFGRPNGVSNDDWCRALYFDANVPVRTCMGKRGYIFIDPDSGYGTCQWYQFRSVDCYRPAWKLYFTPKSVMPSR
jgi:hypothetical protein